MKIAKRLFLTGSIQSLYFRTFVKQNADLYSIKGFVRKREDERIEIFMEGEREKVEAFLELCKKGPQHAIIRNTDVQDEKLQFFNEFKILEF